MIYQSYTFKGLFLFFSFRKGLTSKYSKLFVESVQGEDDESERDDSQHFYKFWGWYIAIMELVKEDITKIENVLVLPLVGVLNHLSYIADINSIKRQEQLKQQALNRR